MFRKVQTSSSSSSNDGPNRPTVNSSDHDGVSRRNQQQHHRPHHHRHRHNQHHETSSSNTKMNSILDENDGVGGDFSFSSSSMSLVEEHKGGEQQQQHQQQLQPLLLHKNLLQQEQQQQQQQQQFQSRSFQPTMTPAKELDDDDDGRREQRPQHNKATLIYSAPTVDTLGDDNDEGLLQHRRFYDTTALHTHHQPMPYLNHHLHINDVGNDVGGGGVVAAGAVASSITDNNNNNNNNNSNNNKMILPNLSGPPLRGPTQSLSSLPTQAKMIPPKSRDQLSRRRVTTTTTTTTTTTGGVKRMTTTTTTTDGNKKSNNRNRNRDFQVEEDVMSVSVRMIPISERSAFDRKLPPIETVFGGGDGIPPYIRNQRKVSPSYQHWQILQKLSNISHIRQLAFSASMGPSADVFWREEWEDWDENMGSGGDREEDIMNAPPTSSGAGTSTIPRKSVGSTSRNRIIHPRRDGRYRSIDPVQATLAALPKAPPRLSNKKHRLPLRSDVGFPNARMEEIQQKQMEIQQETEWEEASPRLIVLVTSDDLGTAVQDEYDDNEPQTTSSVASTKRSTGTINSGSSGLRAGPISRVGGGGGKKRGLPGMPWAGNHLIEAKERNQRHFSRRSGGGGGGSQPIIMQQHAITTNIGRGSKAAARYTSERTSMLAPPLDATYSATMGWRPRPFHDRPPGLIYALVCPLSVDFAVGKIEPLVCSLTLYSLRKGKASEDFYFPAGDWNGKIHVDALQAEAGSPTGGEESADKITSTNIRAEMLRQLWQQRKHKAIFAYNPLLTDDVGDKDLHVVLQVYKVTHLDPMLAYWANGYTSDFAASSTSDRKTWRKRLKKQFQKNQSNSTPSIRSASSDEAEIQKAHLRSNAVFEAFGTQFTTPLCFGITSLFDEGTTSDSKGNQWPKGQVQQGMNLYAFPSHPESQEDFLLRLRKVTYATYDVSDSAGARSNRIMSASDVPEMTDGAQNMQLEGVERRYENQAARLSTAFSELPTDSLSSSKKKPGVRMFMSPKRIFKKDVGLHNPNDSTSSTLSSSSLATRIEDTPMIPGSVTLFTSSLDVDFLQAMLSTPPELIDKISVKVSSPISDHDKPQLTEDVVLPRVLVDASGDSAIMIDPTKTITRDLGDNSSKRSDLVRIPTARPSEHLDSSEFREVLFLPPRAQKSYVSDLPVADHRSLLNLLYIYPRLLLFKSRSEEKAEEFSSSRIVDHRNLHQNLTVRTRLIQCSSHKNESGIIESSNTILESFYNPAPWGGPTLLPSVFTRIPGWDSGLSSKRGRPAADSSLGMPLRDEFKMKLPLMLDGSYFLQFSLFSLELSDSIAEDSAPGHNIDENYSASSSGEDCGIFLHPVAETTIPLSSSSTRDPSSGAKATTVIPNGCHRLRLGDFQLQVETRIVSSIHVSDPAVAAALRDFPVSNDEIVRTNSGDIPEEMAMVSNRSSTLSRSVPSKGDASPEKIFYSTIFSAASGSSVVGHFQPLLCLHIFNLIRSPTRTNTDMVTSEAFLIENMQSLLVIFKRVKAFFASSADACYNPGLEYFIKAAIDSFDEGSLFEGAKQHETDEDSISEVLVDPSGVDTSIDLDLENEENDDNFDGGAIRRRKKHSVTSDIDLRISRTFSAMESSEIPFSRVAFGATKTDRMRLEAELETDQGRFTTLFDDEETVVTLATTKQIEDHLAEARISLERKAASTSLDDISIHEASPSTVTQQSKLDSEVTNGIDFGVYQRSISELALGKRMKSAAQIMLAPCVTPGLSAVLLCRTGSTSQSSSSPENDDTQGEKQLKLAAAGSLRTEEPLVEECGHIFSSPGSDIDDDHILPEDVNGFSSAYQTTKGLFRSPWSRHTLNFSILHDWESMKLPTVARGGFVYESIMVLWLRAWSDHVKGSALKSPHKFVMDVATHDIGKNLFAAFHLQIDILLPLILKSLVLRNGQAAKTAKHQKKDRVIIDEGHMFVFESFVEMLAVALMGQAMAELEFQGDQGTLLAAIDSCDHVVDFLIGLFAVFHHAHMEVLITKFILTLRACETDHDTFNDNDIFEWNDTSIHRVKCSRQLRLRTVEKLAILPNFIAMNYPRRFSSNRPSQQAIKPSWTMQHGAVISDEFHTSKNTLVPDDGMLPKSGWLAALLANESLSICALSCEAVVAEAMAHIETHDLQPKNAAPKHSSLKKRPTATLRRSDLLMFQSIAIHAITCVHELLLRRHAMDKRFQKESCRERIAALFAQPIFDKSLASVRWLARMESTHKVRSIWLLCFVYILQEAPDSLIREAIRMYNDPSDVRIHRFIRLLRLGSSTFQSFIDQERHCMFPLEIDKSISPWLLQESFNTLCATTILVVEESASVTATTPDEQRSMIQGILDLLLHVLTTPQSSVTHLRAVGGAIQALEKFGTQMFLETTGAHLQHWVRVILGLMNSCALSVRSIAVDFVVSLLGGIFDLQGNIDDISLVCTTVLPEVAAREIALCSVSGLLSSLEDAERAVWPLRRSFADVEDANPLDDDRVDPQLSPILAVLCRTCQAIIDGVLIEMRLRGEKCDVVGTKLAPDKRTDYTFDADEESVFEAAIFFAPETAPLQRLRWLVTLKSLHEAKGHWIEAAETLIMSAKTISDSIPHLKNIWTPSRFSLWNDSRRSLWLSTVGEEMGNPKQGNAQVMTFASSFLEGGFLVDSIDSIGGSSSGMLAQPTLEMMCWLLTSVAKEAVVFYTREGGVAALAYSRLESLLKIVMNVLDDHKLSGATVGGRRNTNTRRKQYVADEACLRGATASITGDMAKLAEKLLLVVQEEPMSPRFANSDEDTVTIDDSKPYFVRLTLSGRKPKRFQESTTLPTFVEWNKPCICRVPKLIVQQASKATSHGRDGFETDVCKLFGKTILDALVDELGDDSIIFRAGPSSNRAANCIDDERTYIDIGFVHSNASGLDSGPGHSSTGFDFESRHFRYRTSNDEVGSGMTRYVELSVAKPFPGPLSRQQTMLSSEYVSTN